ncbi:MAG: DUF1549 domain-containing protein [Planctomycetaceae bacterium]
MLLVTLQTRPHLRAWFLLILLISCVLPSNVRAEEPAPVSFDEIQLILKNQCVKCHGPITHEGELDLSRPVTILAGGDSGTSLIPGNLEESLLWQRIADNEMPPENPLDESTRLKLKSWIENGAPGLPEEVHPDDLIHWSFRKLKQTTEILSEDKNNPVESELNAVDRLLLPQLQAADLGFSAEADRATLLRRVSLVLTGLPPTVEEQARFLTNADADLYTEMVEYYLDSPHYGERWGKFWLDAAGYADSNGYFNADTPRPLAYRYRDYVIRSLNQDKPFDQFIREQIAGDELAGFDATQPATPEIVELLEATHYLRNAQDGTDSSDGNPDEQRTDRYSALEGTMQIVSSSLLGLTIQCAKCHSHKFEPITQEEYYQFQAFFYPAFNVVEWQKPATRIVEAPFPKNSHPGRQKNQIKKRNWLSFEKNMGTGFVKINHMGRFSFRMIFLRVISI